MHHLSCSTFAHVSWDDVGGLEDVKQRLKEAVELPFQQPEALARLGVVPPRGGWGRSVAVGVLLDRVGVGCGL